MIEPLANQFKSIQHLKAQADGVIRDADIWARKELESARNRHRENVMIWELAEIFAGPDGLLNYGDVKNTLACTPDHELLGSIESVLNEEAKSSHGYKKDAILILLSHIKNNQPLPPFPSQSNPIGFLLPDQRDQEIKNEINRQLSQTISSQCLVPREHLRTMGTFDLIKKYCVQALEWRSQGILAGVLNLHYNEQSKDRPGSCKGRSLSNQAFAGFYQKYLKPNSTQKNQQSALSLAATDYIKIQVAKYFGPFENTAPTIQLYKPKQDQFVNLYVKFPLTPQVTLRGGVPVTTVKKLMDDFAAGRNNLLVGNLGQLGQQFKTTVKCQTMSSTFVPRKKLTNQKLDTSYYEDETEFRAYFDPDVVGDKYFQAKIQEREKLHKAIHESRANKTNAALKQTRQDNSTIFFHQSISSFFFLGSYASSLTRSEFTKLQDGRVRLDLMYMEQAIDGELSVSVQRPNDSGDFELLEYEGYAIPSTPEDRSIMTPCLEFKATN